MKCRRVRIVSNRQCRHVHTCVSTVNNIPYFVHTKRPRRWYWDYFFALLKTGASHLDNKKKVLALSQLYLEGAALTCYKSHYTSLYLRQLDSSWHISLFLVSYSLVALCWWSSSVLVRLRRHFTHGGLASQLTLTQQKFLANPQNNPQILQSFQVISKTYPSHTQVTSKSYPS